jgi:hypothetical protein
MPQQQHAQQQQQQQQQLVIARYHNLYTVSYLLLTCFEALAAHWPGKLLAGNTIAACFKPALTLVWELMRISAMVYTHPSDRPADGSSSSSNDSISSRSSLELANWVRMLAMRLSSEVGEQQLQALPGLPQQSLLLLAEPVLYKLLGVGLGERL